MTRYLTEEEMGLPSKKYLTDDQMEKPADPEGWVSGGARTVASALTEGTAGLVGLPTTVFNAAQTGVSKLLGVKPTYAPDVSGIINKKMEDLTGGYTNYSPETRMGRITKNVVSMVPAAAAAALTGGTSLLPTIAGGAVVPGVAGELAREGGEAVGTALQMDDPRRAGQWAKMAAEIASPMAASKVLPSIGNTLKDPSLQTTVDDLSRLERFTGESATAGSYRTSQEAAREAVAKEMKNPKLATKIQGQPERFSSAVLRDVGINDDAARAAGFSGGLSPSNVERVVQSVKAPLGARLGSYYSGIRRWQFPASDWDEIENLASQMPKMSKYNPASMKSGDWMHDLRQSANETLANPGVAEHGKSYQGIAQSLINAIDRATARALGPDKFAELQELNGQYSRLLTTEAALSRAAANGRAGIITPQDIIAAGGTRHTQDLSEMARIADNYLISKGIVPTDANRKNIIRYLIDFATGAGVAGVNALAYGISPKTALLAAGTAGGSHIVQKALQAAMGSPYGQSVAKSHALYGTPIAPMMAAPVVGAVDERMGRKSGGRVGINHDRLADQLVTAAERAKKGISKSTEPLLNMPDDHIAHALEVANRSI